jgi:hypothetical protein
MGNSSTVTLSKSITSPWALMQSSHQSNGAVERANGLIFSGIKKCLFDQKKGKWVDKLPKVIWSHNTTVSRATSFTQFRLLFDTEAMIPEEIKNESMRVLKAKEIEEVDQKVEKRRD